MSTTKRSNRRVSKSHSRCGGNWPVFAGQAQSAWKPFRDGISASGLQTFLNCREQFRIKYCLNLEGPTNYYQHYGNVVHDILADADDGVPAAGGLMEFVEVKIADYEEAYADGSQEFELIMAKAEAVMPHYFDYYRKDDAKKEFRIREEAKCVLFDSDYLTDRFPLAFTLDGLYAEKKGVKAKTWIEDIKTFSQDRDIEELMAANLQFNFYMLGLRLMLGFDASGVVKNRIRNPGQKLNQKETLQEYVKRVSEDVAKRPDHYFKRTVSEYSKGEVEEWAAASLTPMLMELEAWWNGTIPHFMNPSALNYNSVKSEYADYILSNGRDKTGLKTGAYWNKYQGLEPCNTKL